MGFEGMAWAMVSRRTLLSGRCTETPHIRAAGFVSRCLSTLDTIHPITPYLLLTVNNVRRPALRDVALRDRGARLPTQPPRGLQHANGPEGIRGRMHYGKRW